MAEGLISFEEWKKLDLRVGEIVSAEQHPNAEKLFIIEVNLGKEIGTKKLVAGLKNYYTLDELVGKKVIVFINLEPAVIRGVKSDGMVLAAVNEDHSVVRLIAPDGEVEIGSKIS